MGTWGDGIFEDDFTADIEEEFAEALVEGLDVTAATARILQAYDDYLEEEDLGSLVYLALAALQFGHGSLQPMIKEKAMAIIDTEAGLEPWQEVGGAVLAGRKKVLAAFREQLSRH